MRRNINPMFLIFFALLIFNSFRGGRFDSPLDWLMNTLMIIPGVVIGLSFHEFAHGWVAYKLGDPTPKLQGRVTVNPMAHIDPIGFIALLFAGFGWGVPVEINPNNFKNRRRDELLVSLAGVVMNLLVAIVFGFVMKFIYMAAGQEVLGAGLWGTIWTVFLYVIQINLVLMIFNLIPVPPLDGFSVVSEIFNIKHTNLYYQIYNNGFFILMFLIIFGITDRILSPGVNFFMNLIAQYIIF
ncbi:MAG: site-2 protease family protein [Anaerovoracaceae bacterium]